MVEINFINHSCFKIKGKEVSLIVDPYDPEQTGYKMPKLDCDILLTTHEHFDHNYKDAISGYKLLIDGAGEYEVGGVFIQGIEVFHDNENGAKRGKSTLYVIEIDDFTIMHCGDLGHELSKETLEHIPDIDVLLIPVGGTYTIDAEAAAKIISSIEPGFVVPMHYQTSEVTKLSKDLAKLDKFLDEMGVDVGMKKQNTLKLSNRSDIPEETEVVIL
ncbi:MAG TPA: MBL fold metallo-hydrolase [Patescibacteria group bacterium]|nr:MBL fold metallo-hydrolase [Patescibacteria group bacterium]